MEKRLGVFYFMHNYQGIVAWDQRQPIHFKTYQPTTLDKAKDRGEGGMWQFADGTMDLKLLATSLTGNSIWIQNCLSICNSFSLHSHSSRLPSQPPNKLFCMFQLQRRTKLCLRWNAIGKVKWIETPLFLRSNGVCLLRCTCVLGRVPYKIKWKLLSNDAFSLKITNRLYWAYNITVNQQEWSNTNYTPNNCWME